MFIQSDSKLIGIANGYNKSIFKQPYLIEFKTKVNFNIKTKLLNKQSVLSRFFRSSLILESGSRIIKKNISANLLHVLFYSYKINIVNRNKIFVYGKDLNFNDIDFVKI